MLNMRRYTLSTPHKPKMQFFQIVSSSFGLRIRRVENDGPIGFQQPVRHPFPGIAFEEFIGDAGPDHPIHPSFQDGRRLPPPVGVDDNDAVRLRDLGAMAFDFPGQERVLGNFIRRQQGIEFFLVQIVKTDVVSILLQGLNGDGSDRVIEAPFIRMGQ